MQRVLFHDTIFGPIHSRRLGTSLGVNLTPNDGKICTFDCLYCEAGFNSQGPGTGGLTPRAEVRQQLEDTLVTMRGDGMGLDVITFSGNGEPTIHPQFGDIVDDVIALRDKYYPHAKVSVLTNSTRCHDPKVVSALKRVDNNIVKLDSAIESTFKALDRPGDPTLTPGRIVEMLKQFGKRCIIQTMFVRSPYLDNTVDDEVEALCEAYRSINPGSIMIYSLDRPTPDHTLTRVSPDELTALARRIEEATGVTVHGY